MSGNKVVVTGLGAVAPNGADAKDFFENSIKGVSGLKKTPDILLNIRTAREECGPLLSGPSTDKWGVSDQGERGIKHFMVSAVSEAMDDSRLSKGYIESMGERCVLMIGSVGFDEYLLSSILDDEKTCDYALSHTSRDNFFLKDYCGCRGLCYNISSSCSSGSAIIAVAAELIKEGFCDLAMICAVDSLSDFVANGFNKLKSLSSGVCRPFDEKRDGINIGEGAGVLVLERSGHAAERNAKIYCEIAGCSMGNEAYHITSPDISGRGFYNSMKNAIDDAAISPCDIDYINVHGTGTRSNDLAELNALKMLYGGQDKKPYISSLKALDGHCMGAAGGLEAVMSVKCIEKQEILPAYRVREPMEGVGEFIFDNGFFTGGASGRENTFEKNFKNDRSISYVMSNSFAFGGCTSSIIFGKYKQGHTEKKVRGIVEGTGPKNGKCYITGISFMKAEPHGKLDTAIQGIPPRNMRKANHFSRLVLASAVSCVKDSGLDAGGWDSERAGTLFSTVFGPVDEKFELLMSLHEDCMEDFVPSKFADIAPNAAMSHVCINLSCTGVSTSFRGTAPLAVAKRYLENRTCDVMITSMAEEYSARVSDAIGRYAGDSHLPYVENGITLLMEYSDEKKGYCSIEDIYSCNLGLNPYIDAVRMGGETERDLAGALSGLFSRAADGVKPDGARPARIYITGGTDMGKVEKMAAAAAFPGTEIAVLSDAAQSPMYTGFYANIAVAANDMKGNSRIGNVLVCGYDVCGNYYIAGLHAVHMGKHADSGG